MVMMSKFQYYQLTRKVGKDKKFMEHTIGDVINALIISEETGESVNVIQKKLWKAQKKGLLLEVESPEETDKRLQEISKEEVKFEVAEKFKAVMERFEDPELILNIHKELDKKHLQDHKEKLSTFICCCTAYLEPQELRKSGAYKGNSSVGKDNLIKATLRLFPKEDWLFLTNATSSVMEDDIFDFKIIAYSEMNVNREDGANAHLVETLKQMTEGGTSSMKKDLRTGYKTPKHVIQEQKTVLYGTTESESDEELVTRFTIYGVTGHPNKTRKVNEDTLDWFAGLKERTGQDSWIAEGIKRLKYNKVIIPYATFLKKKINGKEIFDCTNPRSMRDVKRIMAYTSAVTWLYQKQRSIKDGYIVSDIFDFLLVVLISGNFFNQTYKGLGDIRLQAVLDVMKEYEKENKIDSVPRHKIQEMLDVSRNTVKGYLKGLNNLSMVSYVGMDGNNPMYKRCQKGVKKMLIGINFKDLKEYLETCKGVKISKEYCVILEKLKKTVEIEENTVPSEEIDTLKLTPSKDIMEWDPKVEVWHNCSFPVGNDKMCGDSPCNEFDGLYYCKKHFKEVQGR